MAQGKKIVPMSYVARAIFTGSISFGMVLIPVRVYAAADDNRINFSMLCQEHHEQLSYKRWCPEGHEVQWNEIEKGYRITRDKIVAVSRDDIQKVKPKTTKMIDVQEFVDVSQIDPIFFEKSYYVVPDKQGEKAYSLFIEVMRLTNKAAIGKVVMRDKEYIISLRPYKNGLVMHILHYADELRNINELPELQELVQTKKEELDLAKMLVENLVVENFDASRFNDAYTKALKDLIKAKSEGRIFAYKEEKVAETKNLMEALKISVESAKKKRKK